MHRDVKIFLIVLCGLLAAQDAFAAAAMQRRVQQQKMQQQQMMQQAYQQAMAQKQAQEAAMYQQAMAQRQQMLQQAAYQKAAMEYAAYKQAMQQAVAKRNAEMQAAQVIKQKIVERQAEQMAYQQAVAQKRAQEVAMYKQAVGQKQLAEVVAYKQAMAQRKAVQDKVQSDVNQQVREYAQYLSARKAALAQQSALVKQAVVEQKMVRDAVIQRAQVEQVRRVAEAKVAAEAVATSAIGQKLAHDVLASRARSQLVEDHAVSGPESVVSIQDLWTALDRSSEPWEQIVDKEIKLLTISEYMDRFRKLKVKISKSPGHYAGLIDSLAQQLPGFLSAPFMNVLSYAAIVEYDFESGANKDDLARQVLGPGQFEENRKRVFGR